jgi:hypothetical protein
MKKALSKTANDETKAGFAGYRSAAEVLESRLEFLDGKEKIMMTMRVRQGATFGQIAALAGMHEASVARLVRKIRSRLLKGAFITCLRYKDLLTREQLAIARDRYVLRLSIPAIAKNHNCTLYHTRSVLSQLASLGVARPVGAIRESPSTDDRLLSVGAGLKPAQPTPNRVAATKDAKRGGWCVCRVARPVGADFKSAQDVAIAMTGHVADRRTA